MNHRTPTLILLVAASAVALVALPRPADAQTSAVQKALEEVRTKLDDLVSVKDEGLADDLAFRLQTMKKVVEFSLEEVKTLKVKFLAAELSGVKPETLTAWKIGIGERLGTAESYYKDSLAALTTSSTEAPLTLEGLKAFAAAFKEWRETSFSPLAAEIDSFLLLSGQERALEVAKSRLGKIQNDVAKLRKLKGHGAETLTVLLTRAENRLETAQAAYDRALARFLETLAPPPPPPPSVSSTSTEPAPTSTLSLTATSTAIAEPPPRSIRDEVRASLEAIRETYQIFIAMSAEAKKILR